MELVKPDPLIIGGRAHYTLTSYGPVAIEVDVPYTTDEDVEYALQVTIMQAGGGPAELESDAWIREQFPGISGAAELRVAVRDQVRAMNAQIAEEQKAAKCAEELAKRLMQRVPNSQVAAVRQALEQSFSMSLAQDGMSEADFLAQTGMRRQDMEEMFDQQARASAEHEAAIDAWAEHRKLQVSEEELPQLLGLPPEEAKELIASMLGSGTMEQVRQAALRNKALGLVIAECSCNYRHETPAEASARIAHMQAEQQQFMRTMGQGVAKPKDDHPHLKLV